MRGGINAGARSPAIPADAGAGQLTRGELAVAGAAARRLSNGQIAAALVISARTVQAHRGTSWTSSASACERREKPRKPPAAGVLSAWGRRTWQVKQEKLRGQIPLRSVRQPPKIRGGIREFPDAASGVRPPFSVTRTRPVALGMRGAEESCS